MDTRQPLDGESNGTVLRFEHKSASPAYILPAVPVTGGTLVPHQSRLSVAVEAKPTPPLEASLDDAIDQAPVDVLRKLVRRIAGKNEHAGNTIKAALLVPSGSSNSLKRKTYEACQHCGTEYHVWENHDLACVYHPGYKDEYRESSVWDDCWNSDEEPDSDDPEFQDGWRWTCCDKPGDGSGCVITTHEPKVVDTRVRRFE